MTEWEVLLFVCIVGMVHLWLAVDNLQDHQPGRSGRVGPCYLAGWSDVCTYGGCCRVCMYESGIGGEENE